MRQTLKTGCAKFGATLDSETCEYITGLATELLADHKEAEGAEADLIENTGPLLEAQGLATKQVTSLCKAIARGVFLPSASKKKENQSPAAWLGAQSPSQSAGSASPSEPAKAKSSAKDQVICHCESLILMYMGGSGRLLDDTMFELIRGHRYGIVGHNGSGKTTLMQRLADGAIEELKHLKIVHVYHELLEAKGGKDQSATALAYACEELGVDYSGGGVIEEEEGVAAAHRLLETVGFTASQKSKQLRELSGGWRMRLLLACAVSRQADILLLDEPTNHLDTEAMRWLVEYLTRSVKGATAMIISHDPSFLDEVCTDIVHFDNLKLQYYVGNFSSFRTQVAMHDDEEAEAVLWVRSKEIAKAEGADQRRSKADDALPKSKIDPNALRMQFPIPGKPDGVSGLSKPVIELRNVNFQYGGASGYVLQNLWAKVSLSSRVAVIGPNGAGKSTLLSLICGELRPSPGKDDVVGEVVRHRNLRVAYVAQHHMFHLGEHEKLTPVEYMQVRFQKGYDDELQKRLMSVGSEEEEQRLEQLAKKYGKYGKRVAAVNNRMKRGKDYVYEVAWEGLQEKANTYETIPKLRQLGVERLAAALDARIAAMEDGTNDRSLQRGSIVKHFANFGLDEDLIARRMVSNLSGGQKSKLMIGAAFWTKPHIVLFDEPTNYLDFEAVEALGQALRSFRGGVVVVSHNDEFLAAVGTEIWTICETRLHQVNSDGTLQPPEEGPTTTGNVAKKKEGSNKFQPPDRR